jgi:hypothetical protein
MTFEKYLCQSLPSVLHAWTCPHWNSKKKHVFGSKFATHKKNMCLVSSLPRNKNIHAFGSKFATQKKLHVFCSKFATQKKNLIINQSLIIKNINNR